MSLSLWPSLCAECLWSFMLNSPGSMRIASLVVVSAIRYEYVHETSSNSWRKKKSLLNGILSCIVGEWCNRDGTKYESCDGSLPVVGLLTRRFKFLTKLLFTLFRSVLIFSQLCAVLTFIWFLIQPVVFLWEIRTRWKWCGTVHW